MTHGRIDLKCANVLPNHEKCQLHVKRSATQWSESRLQTLFVWMAVFWCPPWSIDWWTETRWGIWSPPSRWTHWFCEHKVLWAGFLSNDQTYIFSFCGFVFKSCSSHILCLRQADSRSSMDLGDDILHERISMPWISNAHWDVAFGLAADCLCCAVSSIVTDNARRSGSEQRSFFLCCTLLSFPWGFRACPFHTAVSLSPPSKCSATWSLAKGQPSWVCRSRSEIRPPWRTKPPV